MGQHNCFRLAFSLQSDKIFSRITSASGEIRISTSQKMRPNCWGGEMADPVKSSISGASALHNEIYKKKMLGW